MIFGTELEARDHTPAFSREEYPGPLWCLLESN
jgi:hypothetical protein